MASGDRREMARTAVVWDALAAHLDGPRLDVVDIGGGTGGSAVRIAEMGHRVAVVDPSPDALAALSQRASQAGVEVAAHQGDVSELVDVVGSDSADLVLCHGVLEVVDPADGLARIREVLRPRGHLSLLVAQRHAAAIAKAVSGHLQSALDLLGDGGDDVARGTHRFTAEEVTALLTAAGFTVDALQAVRVFADLVPGSLLDLEPGAATTLIELERVAAARPEYRSLATQLHALAR
ncbi:methyltransferase domain-containing protein [Nocardioides panacisoli]|uniref:class I SAM-dependent methyltransferase n=1 Tax=Nocardioides panacisoli TaxID=627624 RepID=UPI001C635736|nr:methyltransferase domain-containing protein [Nocardioides panacisoli]QYJ04727.1 methyltransferase domain-containing protein [Nocardioides panacisoli]